MTHGRFGIPVDCRESRRRSVVENAVRTILFVALYDALKVAGGRAVL